MKLNEIAKAFPKKKSIVKRYIKEDKKELQELLEKEREIKISRFEDIESPKIKDFFIWICSVNAEYTL